MAAPKKRLLGARQKIVLVTLMAMPSHILPSGKVVAASALPTCAAAHAIAGHVRAAAQRRASAHASETNVECRPRLMENHTIRQEVTLAMCKGIATTAFTVEVRLKVSGPLELLSHS